MSRQVGRRRLMTGLYWFLAVEFAVGAATKFWPGPTFVGPAYSDKFAEWGYPPWFRLVVGGIELVCAVLLIIPGKRFRFIAAVTLVLLLTGAVTTHIVNHHPLYTWLGAPTHLLIMATIALATWPPDWRDLLRPVPNERRAFLDQPQMYAE